MSKENKFYLKLGISTVLSVLFLVTSIKCVPVGNIGVIKHLGEVQHDKTLTEGLNFVIPMYTSVYNYTAKMITTEVEAEGASNDLQEVSISLAVQFSFVDEHSYFLQRIGTEFNFHELVFLPAIYESVKAVLAKFTAEELITKRPEVKIMVDEVLQEFLNKTLEAKELKPSSISIANVAITNFNFSAEFNESIELKVRAEQQALQALNEKQKRITDAEAVAEQIRIESIAKAEAIEREGRALNKFPQLIRLKQIEKWDGVLPKFNGSAVPFVDITKVN